jgi:hypothetical protein
MYRWQVVSRSRAQTKQPSTASVFRAFCTALLQTTEHSKQAQAASGSATGCTTIQRMHSATMHNNCNRYAQGYGKHLQPQRRRAVRHLNCQDKPTDSSMILEQQRDLPTC